ncbi:hypothetical protein V6N13_092648 [Hibiscus sabdariffa]
MASRNIAFFLYNFSFSADTITVDHFIQDNNDDAIVSSGNTFALGFFNPGNSRNRYVGIWYYQIPDKTVVWVANRDNPIKDNSGILRIDGRGNLALFQGNQTLPVWSTNIAISGTGNSIAQILDSGNLVLLQNDNRRAVLHCGPNGYCNPVQSNVFECTCFPGFVPKSSREWYLMDGARGCVKKPGISTCRKGEGFVKVEHAKVPDTSAARVDMSIGLKQCRVECLRECSCVAYASAYAETDGGIGCLTWHGDLVDARTYTDAGQDLYIRVDANDLVRYAKKGPFHKKGVLAITIVSAVVLFLILLAFLHCLVTRLTTAERRKRKSAFGFTSSSLFEDSLGEKEIDESRKNGDLPFFDLSAIVAATNNFSTDIKTWTRRIWPCLQGRLSTHGRAMKLLLLYS